MVTAELDISSQGFPKQAVSIDPMKQSLLFINRSYWPDSEATGQLLTELCEYLAPRWTTMALVGQPNWDIEKDGFVREGVQERNDVAIHRLMHSRLPKHQRFARIRNLISFTLAVRRWGAKHAKACLVNDQSTSVRPIIVCETDPFLLPLVVPSIARRTNARVLYYLQDIYPDVAVALGVSKNSLPIQLLRNRLKSAYLRSDGIVVLDEDMRDRLVAWGLPKQKIWIVPNWMDCSTVKPIKEDNPFRTEHQLQDRFVVMHSGNMGMTQRLEVLVEAMKQDSIPANALLMLVGNGAKRNSLEQQALTQKNIQFLDYQPKEKLAASLSSADLHVVSMDQAITGCLAPSKLYGILASGTPILAIVPKGNAVWRLVEQEKLGWTVEPGDVAGISHSIQQAAEMPRSKMLEMGRHGRHLAETLFDKRICCEAFESVLQSICKQ